MFFGRRVELNCLSVAKVTFVYLSGCDARGTTKQRNNYPVAIDPFHDGASHQTAFTLLGRGNHHALNAQKQEIKNPNSCGEIFLRAGAGDCEGVAEKKAINRSRHCFIGENR